MLYLVSFDVTLGTLRPRHTMRQIAAIRRCDTSPRLYCCCDKALALSLSLRYVARIQTSLNSCDRSQRQNSVAATMIFTCHTRRFVAATCRGDVSQRFVASCVSALLGTLRSRTGVRTTARQRTVRTGPRSPSHAMDK